MAGRRRRRPMTGAEHSSDERRFTPLMLTSHHAELLCLALNGPIRVVGIPSEHVPLCIEQTKQNFGAARLSTSPPRFHVEGVGAMGRGRQKAKQTKVARALKYYSPETNYRALEEELGAQSRTDVATDSRYATTAQDEYDEYNRRYANWDEDEN